VYPIAGQIDNCNFNDQTTWEGSIDKGLTFHYDKRRAPGNQYIGEAAELSFSASSAYDFVLSCHVLEHVANPLQAIYECKRVIKENGVLVIVVPNKACTFDHRRPVTTMAHLVQDFEQNVTEADLTHLEEILRLHDLARDPGGGNFHAFKERSERNAENRCLHHHVFDRQLAIKIVDWIGLQIVVVETLWPYHILVVAQKYEQGQQAGNKVFFNGPREGTFGRMT
jgi:SAM-dependent methyltransferase